MCMSQASEQDVLNNEMDRARRQGSLDYSGKVEVVMMMCDSRVEFDCFPCVSCSYRLSINKLHHGLEVWLRLLKIGIISNVLSLSSRSKHDIKEDSQPTHHHLWCAGNWRFKKFTLDMEKAEKNMSGGLHDQSSNTQF
jgi:hypothetical protein